MRCDVMQFNSSGDAGKFQLDSPKWSGIRAPESIQVAAAAAAAQAKFVGITSAGRG